MQEKKNIVKLESQMLQDLTLICNAAYIKIFFSPAAKLPKDKMSYTIATISFCTGERQRHTRKVQSQKRHCKSILEAESVRLH